MKKNKSEDLEEKKARLLELKKLYQVILEKIGTSKHLGFVDANEYISQMKTLLSNSIESDIDSEYKALYSKMLDELELIHVDETSRVQIIEKLNRRIKYLERLIAKVNENINDKDSVNFEFSGKDFYGRIKNKLLSENSEVLELCTITRNRSSGKIINRKPKSIVKTYELSDSLHAYLYESGKITLSSKRLRRDEYVDPYATFLKDQKLTVRDIYSFDKDIEVDESLSLGDTPGTMIDIFPNGNVRLISNTFNEERGYLLNEEAKKFRAEIPFKRFSPLEKQSVENFLESIKKEFKFQEREEPEEK